MLVIEIEPVGKGKFTARLLPHRRGLLTSRQPFLNSCRLLLARGLAGPKDRVVMRYAGSNDDALRSTVGAAAKLAVNEAGPRFCAWNPYWVKLREEWG